MIISTDFGRREATAHLLGAIDPESNTLYLIGEYKRGNNVPISEHIDGFRALYNRYSPTRYVLPPIGDPAGQKGSQTDINVTWFSTYMKAGIFYIPSRTGIASEFGISAGIGLVSTYFDNKKLKVFRSLRNTIDELSNYKYKMSDLMELQGSKADKDKALTSEKPVAYNDHIMDALRGMISMLPSPTEHILSNDYSMYHLDKTIIGQHTSMRELGPYDKDFWSPMSNIGTNEGNEIKDMLDMFTDDPDDDFGDWLV